MNIQEVETQQELALNPHLQVWREQNMVCTVIMY